jgi:hypothetical protein
MKAHWKGAGGRENRMQWKAPARRLRELYLYPLLPTGWAACPGATPAHTTMLYVLENTIDAAATETHPSAHRAPCLKLALERCSAYRHAKRRHAKIGGAWKVREATSQAGLGFMRMCSVVMYDMLCGGECNAMRQEVMWCDRQARTQCDEVLRQHDTRSARRGC